MSFEGYYEFLCERGHFFVKDIYADDEELAKCPVCNSSVKWWNIIDTTNGDYSITKFEIKSEEITKKCEECGHIEIVEHKTYYFPQNKGFIRKLNKAESIK